MGAKYPHVADSI